MTTTPRGSSLVRALITVLVLVTVVGCTNTPAPPLVSVPATASSAPAKNHRNQVVVGVDDVGGGYNPHKIANQSTMTTALASAMLPSVFRPTADGSVELDRTLMESATVTGSGPFTVTYTVRPDASWSDGVPVRAEDFQYLRDQLATQAGVIDAAGYRQIAHIDSADNGRVVVVRFSHPYPGWRSLFSNLLPAHVLKDAPGGWAGALADSFPSSAGPFQIRSLDRDRGELTLERNDRYWAKPPVADTVVLRRADVAGVGSALRSGDDQLAVVHRGREASAMTSALPDPKYISTLPRDAVLQLQLRPVGVLTESKVRRAVYGLLDRSKLIATGDAEPAARADSLIYAPSDRDYRPTMPASLMSHADSVRALRSAGYDLRAGVWRKSGVPLRLTVAAVVDQADSIAVAKETIAQLRRAGIEATLLTVRAEQLAGDVLNPVVGSSAPVADVLVAARATGGDPAAELSSQYGCPTGPAGGGVEYPPASGLVCVPSLDTLINAALAGERDVSSTVRSVERALWPQAFTMPLYQRTDLLVRTPAVRAVAAQPAPTAPFVSAADWERVIRSGGH